MVDAQAPVEDDGIWEKPSVAKSVWPYLKQGHRLAAIDYEEIISKGEPWTDPNFPPDASSLFIDGVCHKQDEKFQKKAVWKDYTWVRASEIFNNDLVLFNNIEPDDVKQGNVDNCYIMATLSGMAERDLEADSESKVTGKTIHEIFITQEINTAGCYAMKFILDGEQQAVVVDDYLPMKKDKKGDLYFAFCKGGKGQREIWMCLLEKAFAKICGSYENTANMKAAECMLFLTGGPAITYKVSTFHMDIRRGKQLENERFDKFYQLLNEATKKQWIVTGSTPDYPDELKGKDEETLRWATINGQGIKYNHCYTILDVRQVNLEKKHLRKKETYTDIIALFRNPSGKSSRGEQWYGDWCRDDDLWSKETKKQLGDAYRILNSSKFWMSLEDMFK